MKYKTYVQGEVVFEGETVAECVQFGDYNYPEGYSVK